MSELRLVAEIAIRTFAVVAAAAILQRALFRDSRQIRRLWIAACVATIAVALSTVMDLRPRIPRALGAGALAATPRAEAADAQPWLDVRYDRPPFDAPRLVRASWVSGAVVVSAWIVASWFALRRVRRGATLVPPRLTAIARDLRAPRACRIEFAAVAAPCTVGLVSPAILLPRECEDWTELKLRAVLAHELTHVRQRDAMWAVIAWLACAALWFAPAVWIIRRRLRAACEFASDEAAAAICGDARRYARILTEVADSAIEQRLALVTPMAGGASVSARVDRLIARPPARSVPRAFTAMLLLPLLFDIDLRTPLAEAPAARNVLTDLRSPSANVRASALYRLARWRGRENEVLPILIRHLGDATPLTTTPRWNFLRDGWAPARHVFVRSAPGEIAAIGAASLGAIATDSLLAQLRSPDPIVRRNAAWALGEIRHPRDISRNDRAALIRALEDGDATVRGAAAWTLGDLGAREAEEPLRAMLARERNAFARAEATASLRATARGVSLEFFRHPN